MNGEMTLSKCPSVDSRVTIGGFPCLPFVARRRAEAGGGVSNRIPSVCYLLGYLAQRQNATPYIGKGKRGEKREREREQKGALRVQRERTIAQ